MISPGKTRYIGAEYSTSAPFEKLVAERFSLQLAKNSNEFLLSVEQWASKKSYEKWLAAYKANQGNFLDHPVWGADRDLGDGRHLYGAMDDRYATNAARVFVANGLNVKRDVENAKALVIGAWDGTESLLLYALGAASVDSVDEVPDFCEMALAQYGAWDVPGRVFSSSLYELDVEKWWQKYDLVYVPGVLYHLTDLPTAMMILWAILKPGGKLAFESVADNRNDTMARYIGPSHAGWNWWSPSPQCYEAMMRNCGFPDGHTAEFTGGRGWWVGTKAEHAQTTSHGAAGFSRPDILRTIERLTRR